MSPNERLNNIILERTIEYNTTPPQNSTAKESNATPEIECTWKERPKSTWPTHVLTLSSQVITCLSYCTSLLAVTIVNNYAVTCPAKIKWDGHFGVLTGMWVFQNITLQRATNSAKSQPKLGLRSTSSNAIR